VGTIPLVIVAVLVIGSAAVFVVRQSRARRLATLRAEWGAPVKRPRNMAAMAASHRSRRSNIPQPGGALDDRTWNDLNLDDVFAAVDRTGSTLGQHALYHRLRTTPVGDQLPAFEGLVARMGADAALRERAQFALGRLSDPNGYDLWWVVRADAIETRRWYVLYPILAGGSMLLLVFTLFWPQLLPALLGTIVFNVAVRYATDHRVGALAGVFRQMAPVIATAESLPRLTGDDVEPLVHSLEVDTPRLGYLKAIARWVSGNPFMLPINAGTVALLLNDVVIVLYEYLNLAFLLDANGVYFGAEELRARGPALVRIVAAIGEVDAAISIASVRAGRKDWTIPRFRPAGAPAILRGIRHPLVEGAVANSITLTPGRGVLITGSNMAGKSTFLRTVGVSAVLSQTVNTCFAQEYDAPVFHVRSCIGRADDLLAGRSYYIVEVESLLELVRASEGSLHHLFLLDELFRGTNAIERIAAGQAVLRELVERPKPHVALAATHDGELVELLPETYVPHHFGDAVGPNGLTFDYELRPGPATSRNAIALLRLHGAPEQVIRRAVTCAEVLDRSRGTTLSGR
jgi:hypothetical protein